MMIESSSVTIDKNGDITIFREDTIELVIPRAEFKAHENAITIRRICDADDHLHQRLEIQLPDTIGVCIREWACVSMSEVKPLSAAGEDAEVTPLVEIEA